jgi:hypothetical protein
MPGDKVDSLPPRQEPARRVEAHADFFLVADSC